MSTVRVSRAAAEWDAALAALWAHAPADLHYLILALAQAHQAHVFAQGQDGWLRAARVYRVPDVSAFVDHRLAVSGEWE